MSEPAVSYGQDWKPGLFFVLRHLAPHELATLAAIKRRHGDDGVQELFQRIDTQVGKRRAQQLIEEAHAWLYPRSLP